MKLHTSLTLHAMFLLACAPALAQEPTQIEHETDTVVVANTQTRLLQLAFSSASRFPTVPHAKNRGRAQAEVVEVCFQIKRPGLAREYVEQLTGWRKGVGLADYAAYCAQQGDKSKRVRASLNEAKQIADGTVEDQAWRRDLVLAKVALAEYLLELEEPNGELAEAALSSGNARVALMLGNMTGEELLEQEFKALSATLEQNDFENSKSMLEILTSLFDRYYGDREQRDLIEKKIRTSWGKLPLMVRVEQLMGFAKAANKHSDVAAFHRFRDEVFALFDEFNWMPETRIELEAHWAKLRFGAGEVKEARADLELALERFSTERKVIHPIFRADALRPIAEAYCAMGDKEQARAVYLKALAAGVENPNSRPRADDLVATCCSMTLNGFEPDEELWLRLEEIAEGLGSPW